MRAEVSDLMALHPKPIGQHCLHLEAGVVGSERNRKRGRAGRHGDYALGNVSDDCHPLCDAMLTGTAILFKLRR